MLCFLKYKCSLLFLLTLICCFITRDAAAQYSKTDTITTYAVIYNGDTLSAQTLQEVLITTKETEAQRYRQEAWTKLYNAVYVTYPYAKRAALIINDINGHLATLTTEAQRKEYLKSREKELKKEFEAPLTNMTVYEGKILMKLINRETGNNCYNLIKEYKGGITARVYQTVAFFFDSDLKQPYDRTGDDADMEKIVLRVAKMYGYNS
jgi:hypothetical protein